MKSLIDTSVWFGDFRNLKDIAIADVLNRDSLAPMNRHSPAAHVIDRDVTVSVTVNDALFVFQARPAIVSIEGAAVVVPLML